MSDTEKDEDLVFSDPRNEEEGQIDEIPKGERNLRTQAYDKSISDIVAMIDAGDIVLDPDYQRNYIWDDKRASLLVESILLNVPIPVIYVSEDIDSRWDVVDGLQRLNSLNRYFHNEFKLRGLEVLDDLNGLAYKDLNPKASRILRNGILRIILIFKESHPDIKYEIFARLNRGSVQLNEQELRNCLYRGNFNDMLHKLREFEFVQALLGLDKPHKRMVDAELLLRHFTIRSGYSEETGKISNYTGNMRSSLNHHMAKVRNIEVEEADELRKSFLADILKAHSVFGINAFQRIDTEGHYDGRINRSLMDSVLIGFSKFDKESLESKKEAIVGVLIDLINNDPTFEDSITIRTSTKAKMEYRVHTFYKKLDELIGD